MDKPLLIRLGTAFSEKNHHSKDEPRFIKNDSLCNPCFAINKRMAIVYLHYLKIIDYHSDVYFHQRIPKNIKNVQHFTMYPYPIYELSFVKEKQKFTSLIRPINESRRIEYKDFLFLTSNFLLEHFIQTEYKKLNYTIGIETIEYHGNINHYVLLNEKQKKKYYFENKIVILDDFQNDVKMIYYDILSKKNIVKYNVFIQKINEIFHVSLKIDNDNLLLKNIVIFYQYLLKLFNLENCKKINMSTIPNIHLYQKYKNFILDKIKINHTILENTIKENTIKENIIENTILENIVKENILENNIQENLKENSIEKNIS
jgi:hypothetical protein